jgi:uncharacterized protein (DUF1499 family)
MKSRYIFSLIGVFMISGVSVSKADNGSTAKGNLPPCPDSPNCVSTKSAHDKRAMEPLPFLKTREDTREKIINILEGMKRTKIVTSTASHIIAECRTALFRFVDDVEFYLDDTEGLVHFRSASRVGYYDFGLNRRRMKEISKKYLEFVQD